MFGVNREKGSGICRGCLSSDRRLSPLVHSAALYALYATLLNKDEKAMDTSVVLFCWECAALMRRMHHFQLQTQKADKMLSESMKSFLVKKSLSDLIISHKHDYDVIIEEKYDTSDKLDIFVTDIKENKTHKVENSENSRVDNIEENDSDAAGRLDDDHIDLNVSSDEENTKNAENTIIKTTNEQYSRKRKHEIDTIKFVATSLLTKRRSERIKNVIAEQNPKALKKSKLKTVKRKKKNCKRKAKAISVKIKIKNELDIHLSSFEKGVAKNSSKNEFDENSSTKQETANPYVNTDTIADENMKSDSITQETANPYVNTDTIADENMKSDSITQETANPYVNTDTIADENMKSDSITQETANPYVNTDTIADENMKSDSITQETAHPYVNTDTIADENMKSESITQETANPYVNTDTIADENMKSDSITQETANPYVNTNTIPDENMKSESSDSDSNEADSDYFEAENDQKVKKASKTNGSKARYLKKDGLIRIDIFRYSYDQLDEYFSKVEVPDEMIQEVLKSEPKYTTEERRFGCQYCGLCFEIARQLRHHEQTRHKQIRKAMLIKDPTSPLYYRYSMYRCNICHKVLRKEHCEAHMKYLHRLQYTCTECDAIFWAEIDADEHSTASHTTFSCKFCNAEKSSKCSLENHIKKWHTPQKCDDCGEQFEMRKLLLKHREYNHPDSSPELRYCVQCNIQFRSVHAYKVHLKSANIHRTEPRQKFPCSECSAVLVSEFSLKCHRDKIHRGETNFECQPCGKFFARPCGLRYHIERTHLKVPMPKKEKCSYCGRAFSTKRTLTHHIRTHTGERPHQCTYCPAAFAQPFPLKKHLATVHRHATDTVQHNITEPQALQNDSTNSLT